MSVSDAILFLAFGSVPADPDVNVSKSVKYEDVLRSNKS